MKRGKKNQQKNNLALNRRKYIIKAYVVSFLTNSSLKPYQINAYEDTCSPF